MLLTDKKEFAEKLRELMSVYNKPADPDVYGFWFNLLKDYSIAEVKDAFVEYAKKEKFPPVPAGVIKYISSKHREPTAEEAYDYIPKSDSQSGFVTRKMLTALGVAEECLAMNNHIGARIAFINTYNAIPEDVDFFYSEACNVDHEEKYQRKINDFKLLESKGWMNSQQKADMKSLIQSPKKNKLLTDENGLSETQKESNKKQATKLRLITSGMLKSDEMDTEILQDER